jgi:hypothetical protein
MKNIKHRMAKSRVVTSNKFARPLHNNCAIIISNGAIYDKSGTKIKAQFVAPTSMVNV